ncbi:MAG: protein-L-isoaspartate(D-aspartate) O-methyltransferase [Ignavibacteria bacterium]|jgi:protein-L-isoaspartate(D-aspartate) O-methyltransferase|nr:protein-L-isoaspartate(D-aspartate) O-methyltransferase [Ignavibacteria bacterium]
MKFNFSKYYRKDLNEKRWNLIENLKRREELSPKVIEAISILPRELFVQSSFSSKAYEDNALPIDCEQTITQPYTVAYQTTLLDIQKGDTVLEIGTGSGYQASILHILGARVFTVERIKELYEKAREIFKMLKLPIQTRFADGTIGWSQNAPFKKIIVTAAAPSVPSSLLEQLAIGGLLVIPTGERASQDMLLIEKVSEGNFLETKKERFKFVPLIGKEGWKE